MATSGENYWPPTGRTSWPLTTEIVELGGGMKAWKAEGRELLPPGA
ncbi:hypothetical protein [Rhodococcus sp. KB6]|nr:hypothetical protein [Rhodococcus sp. KB6]